VWKGGAIYNQGTVVLSDVMVQNNTARATINTAGGGIWSNGSLTVENGSVFQGNSAEGGVTGNYSLYENAFGGAIYIAGGTANITGTFFGVYSYGAQGNIALAGAAGSHAYGGAVYVAGGVVTMNADTLGKAVFSGGQWVVENCAQGGGTNSWDGGRGGALYVAAGSVTLTNDYVQGNWARGWQGWASGGGYGMGGGINIPSGAQVYLDSFTLAHTQYNYIPGAQGVPNISNIHGSYTMLLQIGSFTASPNPITAGSSLTLTASNIGPATPGATITQVSFFYLDSSGAEHIVGKGTQTSTGVWTLTIKPNLAPGAYTLYALANDSAGLFGPAAALTLTVH
jgi:hypothetical protein